MSTKQANTSASAKSENTTLLEVPEPAPSHEQGTVLVSVEGGAVVPSFIGKPLRSAVESAQQSGFELNVIGSGVAREQSPPPGTHMPAGSKIAVRFAR
jgi:hypothetical protein